MPPQELPIASVPVRNVGEALAMIKNARVFCLSASYHPQGGDVRNQIPTAPVTHTVWVMGKQSDIEEFLKAGQA